MRTFFFMLALIGLLCGCVSNRQVRQQDLQPLAAVTTPTFAPPSVVLDDLRRENDAAFSPQAQRAIATARHYLEQQMHRPVDAYYRVTHISNHDEVYVDFVSGYHGSTPEFAPGNFCIVLVREDGSVMRVLPGV